MGSEWKIFDGDANSLYDAYIVETKAPKYVESDWTDKLLVEIKKIPP